MAWVTNSPVGTLSVKDNRAQMNANNTYINTYLGNQSAFENLDTTRDHFWNIDSNRDGRHRFICSPAFTTSDGVTPTDPVVGAGMSAVLYLKTTNTQPQWFNRTSGNVIYQVSPNFISGSFTSSANFTNIVAVPDDVYGEIHMWRNGNNRTSGQFGFFKSRGGVVTGFSYAAALEDQSDFKVNIELANSTNAIDLNLKSRAKFANAGETWFYRITYRAM